MPSDRPRVRVSSVVGYATNTDTSATTKPAWASAGSARTVATANSRNIRISATIVTTTSMRPEAIRAPRLAGGRSRATASPVTRSSEVSVANSGTAAMVRSV